MVKAPNPIEMWLDEWNVQWTFVRSIYMDQVDFTRSLRNQARLGDPIDQEVKSRYVEAMKDGQQFPPIVAWQGSDGFVLIDGNHRATAAKDAGVPLGVYVVSARPQVLTTMTMEANVRHGKPTSEEERVHHALYLVDNGMSQREAAHRMGAPVAKVKKAALSREAGRRADAAGILRKEWESLPETARNRLLNVSTDEGLVAATRLTIDAGLTVPELYDLVSALNDSKSGVRQQAYCEQMRQAWAERIQDRRNGTAGQPGRLRTRSPRAAVGMALGQMVTWPEPTAVLESVPEAEREDLKLRVKQALDKVNALYEAL